MVDEIGNRQEAEALQAVGHRGPIMVGTAHGNSIHDLLKNPDLSLLLGGLSEVTIGDRAARYQYWLSAFIAGRTTYLKVPFWGRRKLFLWQ